MMHVVTVDGKSGTVKAATPVDLIVAVKKRHAHYVMLRYVTLGLLRICSAVELRLLGVGTLTDR